MWKSIQPGVECPVHSLCHSTSPLDKLRAFPPLLKSWKNVALECRSSPLLKPILSYVEWIQPVVVFTVCASLPLKSSLSTLLALSSVSCSWEELASKCIIVPLFYSVLHRGILSNLLSESTFYALSPLSQVSFKGKVSSFLSWAESLWKCNHFSFLIQLSTG